MRSDQAAEVTLLLCSCRVTRTPTLLQAAPAIKPGAFAPRLLLSQTNSVVPCPLTLPHRRPTPTRCTSTTRWTRRGTRTAGTARWATSAGTCSRQDDSCLFGSLASLLPILRGSAHSEPHRQGHAQGPVECGRGCALVPPWRQAVWRLTVGGRGRRAACTVHPLLC